MKLRALSALLAGVASLDNGMSLMNTEAFWQPIIKGLILVAAVPVDMAGRKATRGSLSSS